VINPLLGPSHAPVPSFAGGLQLAVAVSKDCRASTSGLVGRGNVTRSQNEDVRDSWKLLAAISSQAINLATNLGSLRPSPVKVVDVIAGIVGTEALVRAPRALFEEWLLPMGEQHRRELMLVAEIGDGYAVDQVARRMATSSTGVSF
jgi:hypothetical protein